MKNLILLIALIVTSEAMAVCTSPVSRTNFSPLTVLTSTKLNTDLNTLYTQVNELPGDCITDSTVTSAKILDGTIVNADISDGAAIARSKLSSVNSVSSSSSGSFSTTSASYVGVTNLSVSITTTGNPVRLSLSSVSAGTCSVSFTAGLSTAQSGYVLFLKDASSISEMVQSLNSSTAQTFSLGLPGSVYSYVDSPSSGTYTYKVQAKVTGGGSPSIGISNCILTAREL